MMKSTLLRLTFLFVVLCVMPDALYAQTSGGYVKRDKAKTSTAKKTQKKSVQAVNNQRRTSGLHAVIEKVWVDYDVYWNDMKGMRIHTQLTVCGAKDVSFHMGITHYFEYADGRPLWGNSADYWTKDPQGNPQVAAWCDWDITPKSDKEDIQDWWRFIPYKALHLNSGKHKLRFWTFVKNDTSGKFIQEEAKVSYFDYDADAR